MKSPSILFRNLLAAAVLAMPVLASAQGLTLERWTGTFAGMYSAIGTRAANTSTVVNGPMEIVQSSPNLENFVARLKGTLTIPAEGQYTFY